MSTHTHQSHTDPTQDTDPPTCVVCGEPVPDPTITVETVAGVVTLTALSASQVMMTAGQQEESEGLTINGIPYRLRLHIDSVHSLRMENQTREEANQNGMAPIGHSSRIWSEYYGWAITFDSYSPYSLKRLDNNGDPTDAARKVLLGPILESVGTRLQRESRWLYEADKSAREDFATRAGDRATSLRDRADQFDSLADSILNKGGPLSVGFILLNELSGDQRDYVIERIETTLEEMTA